jgi:hypothetical protein
MISTTASEAVGTSQTVHEETGNQEPQEWHDLMIVAFALQTVHGTGK